MLSEFKFVKSHESLHEQLHFQTNANGADYVCLVNPNILIQAIKSSEYKKVITSSVFNICDSTLVRILGRINRIDFIKYPGPDLFLKTVRDKKYRHFLIGGENHSMMDELLAKIQNESLTKENYFVPPFCKVEDFDYEQISKKINLIKPNIIWVGLGAPKQELFMKRISPLLDGGIMIGVGAAFKFTSSDMRAPQLMRKMRIEWLFRLYQEPKRIGPRLRNIFLYLPRLIWIEVKYRLRT